MKQKIFLILLMIFSLQCLSQTNPYLPFSSGAIINDSCIANWKDAGSTTYKTDEYPYWIVDATKFIF